MLDMKRICICIDDFGHSEGVDSAALVLAQKNHISALTAMVGGPHWPKSSPKLRELDRHRVDLGLHVDFTEFTLNPTCRYSLRTLWFRAYSRTLDVKQIYAEIKAQIDAFASAVGRLPDFIDGHQHVHQLPVIRQCLVEVINECYPQHKPAIRSTRAPSIKGQSGPLGPDPMNRWFKPLLIQTLGGDALHRLAAADGIGMNQHLLGVYGFTDKAEQYAKRLQEWLKMAQTGDLIMCHPSSDVDVNDGIGAARVEEFAIFNSARWPVWLDQAGIRLVPMHECASM